MSAWDWVWSYWEQECKCVKEIPSDPKGNASSFASSRSWKNCTGVLALQKDFHFSNCKSNQIKSKLHFYSTFHTGLPKHFTLKAEPLKCLWRQQVRRALSQGVGAGRQQQQEMAVAERSLHHRARLSTPMRGGKPGNITVHRPLCEVRGTGKPQESSQGLVKGRDNTRTAQLLHKHQQREERQFVVPLLLIHRVQQRQFMLPLFFIQSPVLVQEKDALKFHQCTQPEHQCSPSSWAAARFWGTASAGCPPLQPT